MSVYCAGSLSLTVAGTGCCAAAATSSPNFACLPLACLSTPFATLISLADTCHCAAAAATSMARAAAPASRYCV